MQISQESLVRHLRHQFNALLGVSLFSWATMAGLLIFIWLHGQALGVKSFACFVLGACLSSVQLFFLVLVAVRMHRTMKTRSKLLSSLEYESGHDVLTGVLNRRGFDLSLRQAMSAAGHQKKSLTLLYLDLDGFKQVNDLHSHAVGDRLLRVVANKWSRTIRGGDLLARLGGDEFALITGATGAEVEALCERLLGVAKASLLEEFPALQIGVSIGVAEFPRDGRQADELVLAADSAMLVAKALGKSCFQWALPSSERGRGVASPVA